MSRVGNIGLTELRDLFLSMVALTIAFAVLGEDGIPEAEIFLISAVGVGTGFMLHELAHKFIAQWYGYSAEYEANYAGLVMAVILAFTGFIFAAPGGVMIRNAYGSPLYAYSDEADGQKEKKEERKMLWIALAGPMTNIVLTVLFLVLGAVGVWPAATFFAFFINLTLAAFNMIPLGPLDGRKVFKSSPLIWSVVGIPTILIAVPVYLGL